MIQLANNSSISILPSVVCIPVEERSQLETSF